MSFWLNNPTVLFRNYTDFYPKKNMNNIEKANAIMRLSIYFSILLVSLNLDIKWLSVSMLMIIISIFLGTTENFKSIKNNCVKPSKNNPYMNFTLGDQITNPKRNNACNFEDVRKDQLKYFNTNINNDNIIDKNDLYGINNNDREFYTMPSTTLVNDQNSFINYVYGDFGRCKSDGKDCLKHRDNRFHKGRYYYQY